MEYGACLVISRSKRGRQRRPQTKWNRTQSNMKCSSPPAPPQAQQALRAKAARDLYRCPICKEAFSSLLLLDYNADHDPASLAATCQFNSLRRFQASLFRGLSPGGRRETEIEPASKANSFRFYFFEVSPGCVGGGFTGTTLLPTGTPFRTIGSHSPAHIFTFLTVPTSSQPGSSVGEEDDIEAEADLYVIARAYERLLLLLPLQYRVAFAPQCSVPHTGFFMSVPMPGKQTERHLFNMKV